MSYSNPFDEAEAWEVSAGGPMLPVGDHVVEITEAEDETAGTGNPQIALRFSNAQGSIRAWETYHDRFLSKVVSLYDAAGLPRPQPGEFDPANKCRISQQKIAELIGKQVGIVVREEGDNRPDHAGEVRARVQGYLTPDQIDSSYSARATAATGGAGEPDIPF